MPNGIFAASNMHCGICGNTITFDGGPNDYARHGWHGHNIPKPDPEDRIAELQLERRAARRELSR